MVVPPNPSLFVSHFPVLMSAPSHQHSSSSSSRMDARPLVGGTRPTTPPPKQNHIDMCTVRGWATTPRPPRPRRPPLDLQDPDTPPSLGPAKANHGRPRTRHAWGRLRPASTLSAPSNPRSRAKCRPLLVDTIPTNAQADPPRNEGDTLGPLCHPARRAPVPKAPSARPPAPLGRVAIVGGLLSTPCRRVPAATPRQSVAAPSALFTTPGRRVPVPKATSPRPPVTLGRVARVGGFLSTPCRRMPKATPRQSAAAPSALFATPARRAPVSALFSHDEEGGASHGCPSRGSSQAQEQGGGERD